MEISAQDNSNTLTYWHAVVIFGELAVSTIVNSPTWSSKFPDVMQKLQSHDIRVRNSTVLPADLVHEIAGSNKCDHDFYEDFDNRVLYATLRDKPFVRPFDISKIVKISRQEALQKYGAYCLFKAADVGMSHMGE